MIFALSKTVKNDQFWVNCCLKVDCFPENGQFYIDVHGFTYSIVCHLSIREESEKFTKDWTEYDFSKQALHKSAIWHCWDRKGLRKIKIYIFLSSKHWNQINRSKQLFWWKLDGEKALKQDLEEKSWSVWLICELLVAGSKSKFIGY